MRVLDETANAQSYAAAADYHASGPDAGSGLLPAGEPRPRTRPRRRHSWWLALAAVGVLLVGGAYWAGTKATSPETLGKQYAPAPPTVLTAPVVFRRFSETLPVQGTVTADAGYQVNFGPVDVPGAQPIVTQRPLGPGARVANGTLLSQVAGRPVFAMAGATPMYRDLAVGDRGPDVTQFQDDLALLGFPSYDSPGVFGWSTLRAAQAFYRDAGYSLPQSTTSVTAFVSSPVHSDSPSPSPTYSDSPSPSPTHTDSPSPSPSISTPASTPSPSASPPAPLPVVPQAEVVFIPELPATIQSSSLKLGLPVTNPALTLSTQGLRVLVPLTGAQGSLVQPKDTATLRITSAGSAATEVTATVIAVRAPGQDAQSGPIAVLRPNEPLKWSLAGGQAAGTIIITSTGKAVLGVPVAALYTAADGQTFVTVVAPHGNRTNVTVEVGAEIGGYVPIHPIRGTLVAGDPVLVGQ
jgi:HlyD family secretion protein